MKLKKILAVALAATMTVSLAACGEEKAPTVVANGDSGNGQQQVVVSNGDASQQQTVVTPSDKKLTGINIGTWWTAIFDSDDVFEEAPDWIANQDKEGDTPEKLEEHAFNRNVIQMKWDNKNKIEQKYGFKFYWQNLTYEGTKDSINTSIIAGTPDCELYLCDTGMAIPAQLNGLALDLKTILPADHDLFTDQNIMSYLDLGDGKACIIMRTEAQSMVGNTYPLGINMQIIEDEGLEDPRELAKRGEWTWDKFLEYCQAVTKDTDGDGQLDQYGYCGFSKDTFERLVFSNGSTIAAGVEQTLDSPATVEALQFLYDMYNTYNVCYPYDFDGEPWESMRKHFPQGDVAFFPAACWILSDQACYGTSENPLQWDIALCEWPIGPSGNAATNYMKNLSGGEFYIIPANVAEPQKVVDFLYDYWNWFDGDTSIRDDKKTLNWWYEQTAKTVELQEANFEVMKYMGSKVCFDAWDSVGIEMDFNGLLRGDITPAQMAETYKLEYQSALDAMYK